MEQICYIYLKTSSVLLFKKKKKMKMEEYCDGDDCWNFNGLMKHNCPSPTKSMLQDILSEKCIY